MKGALMGGLALFVAAALAYTKIKSLDAAVMVAQAARATCEADLNRQNVEIEQLRQDGALREARAEARLVRARSENAVRRAAAPRGHGPAAMNAFLRAEFGGSN